MTPASKTSTTAHVALGLAAGVAVFSLHWMLSPNVHEDFSGPASGAAEIHPEAEGDFRSDDPAADESVAAPPAPAASPPPHAQALRHPSESFRNTSLVAMIRQAGHLCTEIVSATPATADLAAWRVSCEDAMVYLVVHDAAGGLVVEPLPLVESPRTSGPNTVPRVPE
jgi:hypothetical protein